MSQPIRRGTELELEIEKLAFGGRAVARVEGYVVFVDGAIPGQKVLARVRRKKRQYAEAQTIEVLDRGPDYVEPFCEHFGVCGGCRWQQLSYDRQLEWKRRHVLECLQPLAGVDPAQIGATVSSPRQTEYRNKMEYTFSSRRWLSPEEIAAEDVVYDRDFALGLHVRGFFDKLFNVNRCYLQSLDSVAILREVRHWCRASGVPPYNIRTHQGCWRFLVIREGKRTGQTLVHLITGDHPGHEAQVDRLADHLRRTFPAVTTLVHSTNAKKAQVATGNRSRVLWGPGLIEEVVGGLTFRISAQSFFQTNPLGAEQLYAWVEQAAGLTGGETVWDLYCGTGSITLSLARKAERMVGFEVVEEAIVDAYRNAERNGIDNCRFRAGDLKDVLRDAARAGSDLGVPDVIVTDPPRAGMHPKVVQTILDLAPKRIVAVSCNPATLARDLELLQTRYDIERVQPFDMFPHTPHIECVVKLERKS